MPSFDYWYETFIQEIFPRHWQCFTKRFHDEVKQDVKEHCNWPHFITGDIMLAIERTIIKYMPKEILEE